MIFPPKEPREFKPWHLVVLAVVVISAIGFRIYSALRWPVARVAIGGVEVRLLVADTPSHRFKGWSDRSDMGEWEGMLFVFSDRGEHAMVMRDMRFPLDIVWLDKETIVDIATSVQPEIGKDEAELTRYVARVPSTLVLELPAGFVRDHPLRLGERVVIRRE